MERLPLLPVEDEGRLSDPGIRENFIVRKFGQVYLSRQVWLDPHHAELALRNHL